MTDKNMKSNTVIVLLDKNRIKWDEVEIPEEVKKRIDAKPVEARELSAAGYYAAVRAVYQLTRKVTVAYDGNKPVAEGCYVSISHSGQYAVACASKVKVGIDIESMSRVGEDVFDRIADDKAQTEHNKLKGADRRFNRTSYWCMSEAYFKCTGKSDFSYENAANLRRQTLTIGNYLIAVMGDGEMECDVLY